MPSFMQNADRIVGGESAPSMIPWQVFITEFSCGGTIIDACTILSAAHCGITTEGSIRAGSLKNTIGGQVCLKIGQYLNAISMHWFLYFSFEVSQESYQILIFHLTETIQIMIGLFSNWMLH